MKTTQLAILRDLMKGGRHSRHTVAATGVSLPTADRWLKEIERTIPGVRRFKVGVVSWFEWRQIHSWTQNIRQRIRIA